MSANETHIDFLVDEQDDSHYSVVVSLDIEHVAIVAYIIHGIERLFDVGKILPIGLGRLLVPVT